MYNPGYYRRQIVLTVLVILFFLAGSLVMMLSFSSRYGSEGIPYTGEYLVDQTGSLTDEEIRSGRGNFLPFREKNTLSLGLVPYPVWIRLTTAAVAEGGEYSLFVDRPVEEIDIYRPGAEVPDLSGRINHRIRHSDHFLAIRCRNLTTIRLHEGQKGVIYLRVKSLSHPLTVPLRLISNRAALFLTGRTTFFFGLLSGFLLLVLILNLLFYFIFQERDYLLYSFCFGLVSLALLGSSGFTDLLGDFLPGSIGRFSGVFLFPLGWGAAGLFIIRFTGLKNRYPRFFQLLKGLLFLAPILSVLSLVPNLTFTILVAEYALAVPITLLTLFVIVRYSDSRQIAASFFIAAWGTLGVCVIIGTLRDFTLLPFNRITDNVIWIGLVIHAFLMFMAISDRIRFNEEQKELAERKVVRERNRIAAEIHDSVGADFSVFVQEMMVDPGRNWTARDISNRLKFYLDRIRDIVYMLNRDYDLPERLEKEMAQQLSRLKNLGLVEIESRLEPLGRILGIEKSYHLLRIYNEWIANIIKHAGADRITVGFCREKNRAVLRIVNNGGGIDWTPGEASLEYTEGQGLRSIGWRCRSIGARAVSVRQGEQYLFTVSIPVRDEKPEEPQAAERL